MNLRPWYRSRLFWLGLLVLVSFLWCWSDSRRVDSWGALGLSDNVMALVRQGGSVVRLEVVKDSSGARFSAGNFGFERSDVRSDPFYDPDDPLPPWFAAAFSHAAWDLDNGSQEQESWGTAWWVIVTAYLPLWVGTLVLWQRRKARLWKASVAECAEPSGPQ